MKYIISDLEYIYVRVGSRNISLDKMTDKEFVERAEGQFNLTIKDDTNAIGEPWTNEDKVNFLNDMSKRAGGQPVVVMIKREARKNLERKENENE
jgi:hypothetical protein